MIRKASYCLFTSLIVAVVLFLITLLSCSADQIVLTNDTSSQTIKFSAEQKAMLQNNSQFGLELLKRINANSEEENVFISPLSISIAFQMLLNGAEGATFSEIADVLNLSSSIEEINDGYKELLKQLIINNEETKLYFLNSIWYRNGLNCKQDFISVNKEVYNAEINEVDFNDTQSLDKINNWVNNSTEGKIDKILDEIPLNAVMYLINAIYFKSNWKYKFDANVTTKMDFIKESGEKISSDFMTQKNKLQYYKDDLLSYVEMPYGKDSLYSFTLFLPNPNRNVNQLINELDKSYWDYIINHRKISDGQIFIPKFDFGYKINLKEILISMGIKKAFSGAEANFSKITDGGIFVNRVLHKAAIELNEEGTEAAAVTAIEMIKNSIGSNFYLVANKPFLFSIKDNVSNTILFLGKLVDP